MSSTSSHQHSRSSLSSIFSKQSSITTDDGAGFGAWAQHNYYDLPEEPINFPLSRRPPRKESSSSVSSSSLSSIEQFDSSYSRRKEMFDDKSSFESSLSSTSNFALPAEDVLMNLGFGSTPNILPERFAKEWYEKMIKTKNKKLEEAKRRRGQYANKKQKSLPVHDEEDEKRELEISTNSLQIERIQEETEEQQKSEIEEHQKSEIVEEQKEKIDEQEKKDQQREKKEEEQCKAKDKHEKRENNTKLVSLPSIIVNEKPAMVQQSSSSLEVAEIFRTDDKQPPSRRLSIRSNEDRLCPPSPSAYGLSPNALSPVTVIEMEQLDNQNDSIDQPGELSAISEEELISTATSRSTSNGESIDDRRSAFTSTSQEPAGNLETNLVMFTQDVAIQEDDGRISPIIMRPTPFFEESDEFCIVMDKSTQTLQTTTTESKQAQTNKVHKLCIGTQTLHEWQFGEDSGEFESFVILSSVAVQTDETLTRYKSSKTLRQFNHTLDRLANKARSVNEQKNQEIDVSAAKTQWWFDQLLSPSIERKTLSEYLTHEKEDLISS